MLVVAPEDVDTLLVVPVPVADVLEELPVPERVLDRVVDPERVLEDPVPAPLDEPLVLLDEPLVETDAVEDGDVVPFELDMIDDVEDLGVELREVEAPDVVEVVAREASIASTVTPPMTATLQLRNGASGKPAYRPSGHS